MKFLVLLAVLASVPGECGSARTGGQRGWNSYDGWNGAANESDFVAGAQYLSGVLLPFGFDLATIDGGWYNSGSLDGLDANGRYLPIPAMYPSAAGGVGFKKLGDKIHGLGLRFGLWTIRGIPKAAVQAKLPIAGSAFTADEAAREDQNCSWDADNYGVLPNAAGKAWYQSLAALYKSWGVDFCKMDCMVGDNHGGGAGAWDGLYTDDFSTFATAFAEVGIEVSVSPGTSMNVANASFIGKHAYAAQYRITQDLWDRWYDADFYPTGLKSKLSVFPAYAPLIGNGQSFPDGDMLPIGQIYHNDKNGSGVYGPPSPSHLSDDEQRLMLTLWCIARAPLTIGSRLPLSGPTEAFTLSLLTNPEVLAVQNASNNNGAVPVMGSSGPDAHAWTAIPLSGQGAYVALFNAGEEASSVAVSVASAYFPLGGVYCVRDLWARANMPDKVTNGVFAVPLAPHAAGLYLMTPC